jgi:putative hemolysin
VEAAIEILVILGLVLLNGFFSGAELAVLTAKRNRLEQAATSGSKGAQAALALLSDTNRFLSAVQIGITGVGTLAAAYGGVSLVRELSDWLDTTPVPLAARYSEGLALAIVTGSIAFASLVFGELVPKRVALAYAEALARFVAIPMFLLSYVARPIIALLGYVTSAVLSILRINVSDQPIVTVDDIAHLVETSREQGVLRTAEEEVLLEALQLRSRRARDVMRSRIDIDAVDVNTPPDEIVGVVAMSGFSRLPVYEDNLDHIIGFIYNKDLLMQLHLKRQIDVRRMLRQPLLIPESLTLEKLLVAFQERRTQMAIVLDEFGGTRGLVTFEDILEELVGEIYDEHRRDEQQAIVQRDDRSWLVDGRVSIRELSENLPEQVSLGQAASEALTVAGLAMAVSQSMPNVGDRLSSGDVTLEIVDMDGPRIDRILVVLSDLTEEQQR